MSANVGLIDRALRLGLGLALIGAALGLYGPVYQSVWAWIGVVPVLTALVGYCPAYSLVGLTTCRR